MNLRRILPLLVTLVPLAATHPTDSVWRLVETTDDLTGATDRRLILRADNWSATVAPNGSTRATLVVACGDRLPNADGRSLLFFAGQPLEPIGNELAYAELRFDNQPTIRAYLTIVEVGDARRDRQVAFLGTDQSPYFSAPLFARLLAAERLAVTIRAYGEVRTVAFHPVGLREALGQLPDCRWTG